MVQGKMNQKDFKFRIQVSSMDCTGCSVCASACPVKCLTMKSFQEVGEREAANWEFAMTIPTKESAVDKTKLRDTMFNQPLLEFSGACEGCNETALVKLATQLFGNRMVIANATGCSSIWGATWGTNPYTVDAKGRGPAWGNSLFEDNAEYGFGMFRANKQRRALLLQNVKEVIEEGKVSAELKAKLQEWTEKLEDADACDRLNLEIKPLIEKEKDVSEKAKAVYNNSDMFVKISQWIIGGDGWAYDIGYNGVDHVLASGENVNILVLDTEMYSNTGGQKSKATNLGAVVKFASNGCRRPKKDLGAIAMQYQDVYVASISLGANPAQAFKAFKEAESYNGVSIIIAYCPCKEQGVVLAKSIEEAKLAVSSGYWSLYRYDPRLIAEGKPALQLDSKEIKSDLEEFLNRENRYALLGRNNKPLAEQLHAQLKANIEKKLAKLTKLSEQN
jgi:pyruvate-ferredoxin/flavodoxin oxidoreductase